MAFLQGKKILITGLLSNRSIALGIAEACRREGAELAFTYVGERFKDRITAFAKELGSDMVVNAVAALAKYPKPIAIFDFETATTLSVIGKDGAYLGGALVPGIRVSVDAMSASTAQLPYITLAPPAKLICSSTVSCMQSGAVFGSAATVDGLSEGVERELGEPVTVVLTGSYGGLVAPYCRRKIFLDENLQLDGLRILYEKNLPKRKKNRE